MTAGDDEIIDGSIPLQRYINIVREKDERVCCNIYVPLSQ